MCAKEQDRQGDQQGRAVRKYSATVHKQRALNNLIPASDDITELFDVAVFYNLTPPVNFSAPGT